jgi:plasmid stabilization system protein ParE
MRRELIVLPEARRELADAYHWYEERRSGLGEELLLVVDAAIEQIRRSPETYPVVHRNVRRVLTKRFPYGVFYVVEPERIVVLAVFHGRRDPRIVRKRH